jgi:hypothetical protein
VKNHVEREMLERRTSTKLGIGESALRALVQDRLLSANQASTERPTRAWQSRSSNNFNAPQKIPVQFVSRATTVESNALLDTFSRQLLIAVLSDVRLGKTVLEMPSIIGQVATASGKLSTAVSACLEELSVCDLPGLSEIVEAETIEFERVSSAFVSLLEGHGLEGRTLVAECVRQLKVGGTKSAELVSQTNVVLELASLKTEKEEIRRKESEENDAEAKARLAQEKLEKRRREEQLKVQKTKA